MAGVAWVQLELDLRHVTPFSSSAALPPEFRVVTLAELGDEERRRQAIYALNRECAADIPDRGEFFTWEKYKRVRFEVPQFRPDGQILGVMGQALIGLCQVSQRPGVDWAYVEMTGVRRDWRSRGIATALKLRAIDVARTWEPPTCAPCTTLTTTRSLLQTGS